MGKKLSLIPFLFKPIDPPSSSSSWPWPAACGSPKTLSFRGEKIMNSVYVTESRFTNSSESESAGSIVSTAELVEEDSGRVESIENVIRGLKSDRLFFEEGETSSCILGYHHHHHQAKASTNYDDGLKYYSFEESSSSSNGNTTIMEMDSRDPFVDFKRSMEEMVEAHGLKDNWEGLQELLGWYLKVNGKSNHGYIIGAFVDLLVAPHFASSSSSSFSSSSSSSSSSCSSVSPSCCDGAIDSCSATAITQSHISALSFSSSSASNCTSPNCLSSLEEAAAAHDHLHQEKTLVQDDQ